MIWFPKIGDALESRAEPGGVYTVVGVRREGPTRDRSWELFEVAILCVVRPTGQYVPYPGATALHPGVLPLSDTVNNSSLENESVQVLARFALL